MEDEKKIIKVEYPLTKIRQGKRNEEVINPIPQHVTFDQYNKMREAIKMYWLVKAEKRGRKSTFPFFALRDSLFIELLWVTGGRVTDICQLNAKDFDFQAKTLTFWIEKANKFHTITIDVETCLTVRDYTANFNLQDRLFNFKRVQAFKIVRRAGELIGVKGLHPHTFRHGLAIYLRMSGIALDIISRRLGHANIGITMKFYQNLSLEEIRTELKDVKWKSDTTT
ncbi:MAG: hypothetical protein A2W22_05415 [Candidatus Levybacteria bacterium RBG_16_35_11]|nr:MAG: hypothetical protein A2W22_05415 [Candidatus Levybacteria bacterium RBG_16_35_11]